MKKVLSVLLVLVMVIALAACGKEDYTSWSGIYYNEKAERATMWVEANGSDVVVTLQWSNSAYEAEGWELSGTVKNGKLKVTDMESYTLNFEDIADGKMIDVDKNGKATLVFKDNTITFKSCSDNVLKGMVFIKEKQ